MAAGNAEEDKATSSQAIKNTTLNKTNEKG